MEHTQTETELEDFLTQEFIDRVGKRPTRTQRIAEIVDGILDSYDMHGGINDVDGANVPSQQHIIHITQTLQQILFPGYYDHGAIEGAALPYVTGERVAWVYKHLSQEINRCLCFECTECNACDMVSDCATRAEGVAMDLLATLPEIRALLQLDVQAALDGDPAANSTDEVILAYPSIAAITVHRLAHYLYQREVPLLPRIMSEHIHHRTGIDIHPGAQIGRSFFIDHGTGVVIGETTVIGDRVKLYQGVTLGGKSVSREMKGHKRHPTIEDDVTVYSGTTILGGETVIGRGSIIGGNVWVVSSVPPYSKVYNARSTSKPVVTQDT